MTLHVQSRSPRYRWFLVDHFDPLGCSNVDWTSSEILTMGTGKSVLFLMLTLGVVTAQTGRLRNGLIIGKETPLPTMYSSAMFPVYIVMG